MKKIQKILEKLYKELKKECKRSSKFERPCDECKLSNDLCIDLNVSYIKLTSKINEKINSTNNQ